jgi:hypothetical protein
VVEASTDYGKTVSEASIRLHDGLCEYVLGYLIHANKYGAKLGQDAVCKQ